jgi:cytochrome c oxidase subunit I+III
MTIGFGLVVIDLVVQLRYGRRARRDPWDAGTLEWAAPIPPPPYGLASIPDVGGKLLRPASRAFAAALARGEGYLGFARNGWQETLGVHITSGVPEQLIVLPRPTYLPLYTALATAAAVLAMLFKFYPLSLGFALLTAGLFVFSAQHVGSKQDYGPMPIGLGVSVPPHTEVAGAPSWLALICALFADGTLFASLVVGTFYLWIAAPNWSAGARPQPSWILALAALIGLALAAACARGSLRAASGGHGSRGWIILTAAALLAAIAAVTGMIAGVVPRPQDHALGATAAALLGYVFLHAAIGVLFLVSNLLRLCAGFISPRRLSDLRLTRLWLDYTATTGLIALGLVLALPTLVNLAGGRP